MKKFTAIILSLAVVLVLFAACGGNGNEGTGASSYADATEVLSTVWAGYADEAEENKFPIGGGDSANLTMDAPGKFDIAATEELDVTLALPASQTANIEDAASMVHMMNANNFTGAAYKLKEGTDVAAFAKDFQDGLNGRQWMCGFPERFVVIQTGNFVVTAFGNGQIIELFATKASNTLENAAIVLEGDIAA
ncbi:MAG: hypothetical protein E7543_04790 [Ruminococcaceae bacterium]|nr:hypothetical protein [Oscillospiraceae bacterium]MBQ9914316.1 hypothetical protein [Clostridia bacterium]